MPSKPNFSEFFDKVVLINLKRRKDRLEHALRELKKIKWPFLYPELIEGIDGQLENLPIGFTGGLGALGCSLSHIKVLEKAIQDGVENLLILEDDIVFEDDFVEGIKNFLSDLPDDWDALMFGGNHFIPPKVLHGNVCRCNFTGLTHAYVIRRRIMADLLNKFKTSSTHTDMTFAQEQRHYKVYAPHPFIVTQNKLLKSDISMARKKRGETNSEHQKKFEPFSG